MSLFMTLTGIVLCLFFLALFFTSLLEKERRAALICLILSVLLPVPYLIPVFSKLVYPEWIQILLVVFTPAAILILFFPYRGKIDFVLQHPDFRFDERDIMFSRRTLVPGSERFDEYYRRNPDNKIPDNQFRKKPGLLKAGTKYYDPILFAVANSLFEKVEELHPRVEGEISGKRTEVDPELISATLLDMITGWGAHSAGITRLRDYHVYSTGGRGDRYGQELTVDHQYAIALTVEMDFDMMRTAPAAPTAVESARQYLQSGLIAVQIAEFIRSLGYLSRAHIDANYKVICPLVARDAGLGQIGRMGLLMTPRLGPRCRIAVITTDLPLVSTRGEPDPTVIDFCRHCEKCAVVCPSQSVPFGQEKEMDGVLRWQISSEGCYTYWCQAGTDCGRCVIVCPFAHPDNWFHRIIRFGLRKSYLFRRVAIPMDDLFYGKKPKPRKAV